MKILVVDVGGTHVKVLASGQTEERKIVSGPRMTARRMVDAVLQLTADWQYDVVSLGYPGPVVNGILAHDPVNLGPGWIGFDFGAAFGKPVRIINDAAMQALGSYEGGRMLFLGLGTGLGTAMVVDGMVQPMELGHMPYKRKQSYEDFVGLRGLERLGKKKWRVEVAAVIEEFRAALRPDYIVLGGGNAKYLDALPPAVRLGNNANAFIGGFRLWHGAMASPTDQPRQQPEIRVLDDPRSFAEAAARLLADQAAAAVATGGRFTVALSGGSTPLGLYDLLAQDEYWRGLIPWQQTQVFWGDERHVPPDHADSNFLAAQSRLLAHVPLPPENVHRVRAELTEPELAATEYEADLRKAFGLARGELPRFDVILLGLGSEGHTASLFPGTTALAEQNRLVVRNWVGKLFADRITLTPPVLNHAALVVFLVTGRDKALVLKAILEGPLEPEQLPAQLVNPTQGRVIWLLDRDAAALLSS
jgi:polyphosphate glucokinase